MGIVQRVQVVADRAWGIDQEHYHGIVHRRKALSLQASRFGKQRLQSIHGWRAGTREGFERTTADREAATIVVFRWSVRINVVGYVFHPSWVRRLFSQRHGRDPVSGLFARSPGKPRPHPL